MRGSGVRIAESAKTLGYVFGYRNMNKAAILDHKSKKKTKVLGTFSFILKKSWKKPFLKTATI